MDTKLEFFKKYIDKKGENHRYGTGKEDNAGNKYIQVWDGTKSDQVMWHQTDKIKVDQVYQLGIATCGNDKSSGGDGSCEVGARKMSCTAYSVNKCAVYSLTELDINTYKYVLSYDEIVGMAREIEYR